MREQDIMEYNTQKEELKLAEYGRYVQDLVDHALTIESKEERNKAANAIVQIMTQMNPGFKGNDELQQKLWDDLFIMSNYKLDVDSPFPKPEPKNDSPAEKITYPDQGFKFRHYGKIIEDLIDGARKIEDVEEKKALTGMIANLMKKSYLNFNRDSVNDEMIVDQLKEMSNNELEFADDFKFQHTNDILSSSPRRTNKQNKGRSKRKWKK
ncbi:MAG: DUF4290 domain-containing protein [Flavobacteriales bacterium]|nr:DUF4290 domain-containing protein [Flavobacteriales bacterium]MBT3963964.1 DUF4290 domain-containing protein [Flavobacteriales bacterium]MBT6132557.1 DUF4290 domain-containing protein [Flavobacteriales bacterium]MBT6383186.1 DUF4290 domain-containing protein [Flavobacteriales bacterium]MBT6916855.1 DUF4290 domain-containing protein [Flavobacteriales bacterium]